MMESKENWSLRESHKVGLGNIYSLNEKKVLTIGRDPSCDVVIHVSIIEINPSTAKIYAVQSQSVDEKHAIIEWSRSLRQYSIRDLNTVNGVSNS